MSLKNLVIVKRLVCLEREPGKHQWAYVWFDRDNMPVKIRWIAE